VRRSLSMILLAGLAMLARAYDWQFEQVDTVGNWSSPALRMSGTGVLHFCYRAPGNGIVHSYLDSVWHREELGPFDTLAGYRMDAGPHGEFGVLVNLTGGNIRLYEREDTAWLQDSVPVPANTGLPFTSYDTGGAPSVAFHPSGSDQAIMFARRTDHIWAAETVFTAPYSCRLVARALIYTVEAEPCAMAYVNYSSGSLRSTTIILLIEQGDTWPYHSVAGAGSREAISASVCTPDTGKGAAVLFDYRDEFHYPGSLYYAGFGTGASSVDLWASAEAAVVHGSGTPHVAYIVDQLRYACRVGAAWYRDTISTASNLQLAGIVLKDSLPIIGFIDPATGVWIARRQPVGIQEQQQCPVAWSRSTIVRGVLLLQERASATPSASCLLDVSGRKVMGLKSGANDVRALAPGVYFVRGEGRGAGDMGPIRKVVLTE
jgi:hypothetical protein